MSSHSSTKLDLAQHELDLTRSDLEYTRKTRRILTMTASIGGLIVGAGVTRALGMPDWRPVSIAVGAGVWFLAWIALRIVAMLWFRRWLEGD